MIESGYRASVVARDDWETLLKSLGEIFEAGVRVDWNGFDRGYSRRRVDLPTYPFHRSRCWAPDTIDLTAPLPKEIARSPRLAASVFELQQRLEREAKEWFPPVVWRETSRLGKPRSADSEQEPVWLVIGSPSPLREGLAAKLRERSQQCVVAGLSEEPSRNNDEATLRRDDPQQFDRLLPELKLSAKRPLQGVILLAPADETPPQETAVSIPTACETALYLTQSLQRVPDQAPQLYFVTQGGQEPLADRAEALPAEAALWGLGRMIAAELPRWKCTRIDLDPVDTDPAASLFGEIWVPDQQREIALRGTRRFTSRVVPPSDSREMQQARQQILQARPAEQSRLVLEIVAGQVGKILGTNPTAIDREQPLAEMGLDSLMGVELKNAIEAALRIEIPLEQFTAETSVRDLCAAVEDVLGVAGTQVADPLVAEPETSAPAKSIDEIESGDYDIRQFPEIRDLQQRLTIFQTLGIENPFFDVHEGVTADTTVIDGREMINFASYNYLGSSGAPEVSAAAKEAVEQFGTSVSASRVVSGEKTIHRELEAAIARFLGAEDAVVFVGGHSTNETTIGHLLKPRDLILHDELSHNSIIQGCLLSESQRRAFPHNDFEACEKMLREMRGNYGRVMIVVEGVYSMDGDYPDLPRFVDLRDRYKAMLFVDEAHSIGTLGATGHGIVEHFGMRADQVDLLMGTLSKSFGSCGGYIAGCKELVMYLKYTAPGFVYSVGLSPPNAAAALAAIRRVEQHPEIVQRCIENSSLFLKLAKQRGLDTGTSNNTPVVPVIIGNSMVALMLSRRLHARGINVQPILHPAVEEKAARLRFFITSEHSAEQIRSTVAATAEELEQLKQSV